MEESLSFVESGSSGEQRSSTEGWEYIHIFGTLSSDLTLQLSGAASGNIRYWCGLIRQRPNGWRIQVRLEPDPDHWQQRSYIDCFVVYTPGVLECS
jgi:hypothetical protein